MLKRSKATLITSITYINYQPPPKNFLQCPLIKFLPSEITQKEGVGQEGNLFIDDVIAEQL